jgi:hypothetical protein
MRADDMPLVALAFFLIEVGIVFVAVIAEAYKNWTS